MPNPVSGSMLGPYQVEGVIGAGSMGDVFRGIDTGLHRRVAIKILSEKHRDSHELRARFVREGRAVAAISHPNVVQVFTTGTFDERPYIAMEFLDGIDLGSAVETGGPLPSLSAARAILDAAHGLRAAAQAGLIHRDVKPSNLVLLGDGRVKVTDFGLAKPVDPGAEPALTAMGVVVGTPDYIAPEQARGETIDERVDLYALGGSLYYLLTGSPPFRTGKAAEDKYLKVVARHLRQPAPDARSAVPSVDDELAELTRALMAKRPSDRPDYATLIARLQAIIARLAAGGSASTSFSRPPDGSGGMVDKTPFVGGAGPRAFQDADAAPTSVRVPSRPPPEPNAIDARGQRPLPPWLWLVTVAAIATFAIGLSVFLASSDDAATTSAPPAGTLDAGPAPGPDADVTGHAAQPLPPRPIPPPGMVLVEKPDGTPWFFADTRPVSHGAFAQVFSKHKRPGKGLDEEPVTRVAYTFARAFAQSTGKRLLASDEWDAAVATPGVVTQPGLWEWVDGGDDPSQQGAPKKGKKLVKAPGRAQERPAGAQPDVTFRLGRSLH